MSCFNALRPVPMQIDPGGVATQWLCSSCSSVCAGSEAFVFKLIALHATRCISARRAIWAAVDGKGASMRIPRSLDEDMQCWHHAGGISEYFAIPKSAPCQSIFFAYRVPRDRQFLAYIIATPSGWGWLRAGCDLGRWSHSPYATLCCVTQGLLGYHQWVFKPKPSPLNAKQSQITVINSLEWLQIYCK